MEIATFAAGCFWGVEAAFRALPGVADTAVGYAGGHRDAPTYEEVCTGLTGHAEVVRVEFDPELIGYERLLEVFFECHDPTQVDRQGPDVGTQYRSAIFTHSLEQQAAAAAAKADLDAAGNLARPVATVIEPAATFHRAEEYHQRYFEKNGVTGCHLPPPTA
jgi:peptide-methionine (S)-S-oxide reductase